MICIVYAMNRLARVRNLFSNNETLIVYLCKKNEKLVKNRVDQFGFWEASRTCSERKSIEQQTGHHVLFSFYFIDLSAN